MRQNKGKWVVVWVVTAFLLSITGTSYAGGWANPDLLVDVDTVKANVDKSDWVVVDCRDLKDYVKGHIPGAISLGKRCKKILRDPTSRVFQNAARYEKFFGKAGIGNDTHVVFYYDGLGTLTDATVGFWIMEYLGHDKAHVLNGGLEAWRKAGNRLVKKPTMKEPKTFKAHVVAGRLATSGEIVRIAKEGGAQLIDSRSGNEYQGKDIRAVQGGHVPNAVNIPHIDTLKQKENRKTGKMQAVAYLDPGAAAKHFGSLDKKKRTISYCQTGTRSTLTYLQFRLLGFENPANWDDSWRVYGSDLNAGNPVETDNGPQYWNFAGANKKIKKLEKAVKKLQTQLKQLQGGK